VLNAESKTIYEERLYQLRNAMQKMKRQDFQTNICSDDQVPTTSCKEYENIIKHVRLINQDKHSLEDSRSLKIWTKVVFGAPLTDLVMNCENGFDLVKILLEKLWQDATTSQVRISKKLAFEQRQK